MVIYRKLVAIGDGGCGKTSLLTVFQTGKFVTDYVPTIFETATVEAKYHGKQVEFALWDTAGQEDYARLRPLAYTGTHVALVCFSVDSQVSLLNVKTSWIPEFRHYCPCVPYILIGTKKDLRKRAECQSTIVPYEVGVQAAKELRAMGYLECSALEDEGVVEVFALALKIAMEFNNERRRKCVLL